MKPTTWQFCDCDLFGMVTVSDPFTGLSDLQLGDEKVTLNHLVDVCVCVFFFWEFLLLDGNIFVLFVFQTIL